MNSRIGLVTTLRLESFSDGEQVCASHDHSCSHIFHRNCIYAGLLTSNFCPCCRRNFLLFDNNDQCPDDRIRDIERAETPGQSIEVEGDLGSETLMDLQPHFTSERTDAAGETTRAALSTIDRIEI